MNRSFAKLSGAGNDFVVIDNRRRVFTSSLAVLAVKICKRKTGIGADGVLVLEKSTKQDFKMRVFNPDGSEAEMCGNGARCLARYAYLKRIAPANMIFETKAGIISAQVREAKVKLRMSEPHSFRERLSIKVGAKTFAVSFVNTGVPHAVVFVKDLAKAEVGRWGRAIRYHEFFKPAGANVNFVAERDRHTISLRTYERGVEDETLSCGTGSVAATLISAKEGKVISPVEVVTSGGEILKVYFSYCDGKFGDVYLEGEVKYVFEGVVKEL